MSLIRNTTGILLLALFFTSPLQGQTVKGKSPAATPPAKPDLIGVIVDLTKNETNDLGTVTVKGNDKNAKPVTYNVTEATRFEYFNEVNTWKTNFLAEHRGAKVAIFAAAGSTPPAAAKVQILLPKPKPSVQGPPPAKPLKPSWAHGTVVDVKNGVITIKLPNYTPPPPVTGTVTDVGVDKDSSLGTITVQTAGKLQTFVVDPTTYFQKLKGKSHVRVSFLSIDQGETVEIFARYGAPHAASKVDVLEKGAGEAAIVYKDHFLTFVTKPATKFEFDRAGKLTPASLGSVVKGESVAILPDGLHSHVADDVRIIAPHLIHGVVVNAGVGVITVKVHEKGKDQAKTVPLTGATTFEVVTGKTAKPGGLADAKPGQHVDIWPAPAPPHVAEKVVIHMVPKKPGKPLSFDGVAVAVTGNTLTVTTGGSQKSLPLHAATKFEAIEGSKRRPAKATDFKAGQKVHIVAAAEAPHAVQSVEIHVVAPKAPPKIPQGTPPKQIHEPKKGNVH